MTKSLSAIAAFLGAALPASSALADGGYYAGTLGAHASGRGGAVVASTDGPAAAAYNPAGLAKVDGIVIQLGNTASYNGYSFTRAPTDDWGDLDQSTGQPIRKTFAPAKNGKPWQALDPLVGIASNLGRKDLGVGLAVFAPPGISRLDFPRDGGQRYMMISREAMILEYVAALAWKYQDRFGIGASAQWIHVPRLNYSLVVDGAPAISAKTANPVSSGYDIQADLSGSSLFTFNATLGAWYRPVPSFELALSGQVVPTDIVAKSTLSLRALGENLTAGKISTTRNVNGKWPIANDVTVTLPLPMVFRAGGRYRHLVAGRQVFDIELDVDYTTWSRAQHFTVATNGLNSFYQGEYRPIGDITIEKHWRDTVAFRLGGDYAVLPGRLTVRAGGYYESAVADPAYANVDFSGGPQVGGGLGASVFFGKLQVAIAYQLRVQPSVSVSEAGGRVYQQVPGSLCTAEHGAKDDPTNCHPALLGPSPVVNAGTYDATSHFLALDLLYRYAL
jgi:long-subunit fatty acid transport protein